MGMSPEQQQENAARRAAEAKARVKVVPTVIDWDVTIARFKVMMVEMYKPQRGKHAAS